MKKLLAIVVLGLLWSGSANAADLCFQKLNDYQVHIYKFGLGYAKKCDGYVLDSKIDKKFYKYLRPWRDTIGSSSREEEIELKVLKANMFRLSANNPDPKFQTFVKSVLGYNFKNHPVRKSADEKVLSFSEMGAMNIDTQISKKTLEPLPKAITVAKKPTEKKSFEAYVGITQLTHVTKVKAQSREDALNAGILHCRKLYKNDANDCFVLKLFADNKLSETHNRSPSLIKFNREVKKIKTFDLQYKISDKPLIASLHFERRRIIAKNPKIASPKVSNKTSVKTKTIKTTYKNTSLFDLSYDPLINIELLGDKFYEGTAIRVPENMKKIYGKGCNAMKCMGEAAAREMSRRFKRNEQYNSRYPGNIFFAMAYFELFYENKFYDNQKFLKKVKKEYPNQSYSDGIKIYNLIKLNRVRSKLRNTLGMTLLTPNIEAVNTFWAMGEYLEKNKSSKKIDKNLSKDLKKRLDILEKYREVSRSIQKKIDEEKEDEMKKLLANKKNFFN